MYHNIYINGLISYLVPLLAFLLYVILYFHMLMHAYSVHPSGYKQRGQAAVDARNVFYYLTYEGAVDMEKITDVQQRLAMQQQIQEFGQCPAQLFTQPHPQRQVLEPVLVSRFFDTSADLSTATPPPPSTSLTASLSGPTASTPTHSRTPAATPPLTSLSVTVSGAAAAAASSSSTTTTSNSRSNSVTNNTTSSTATLSALHTDASLSSSSISAGLPPISPTNASATAWSGPSFDCWIPSSSRMCATSVASSSAASTAALEPAPHMDRFTLHHDTVTACALTMSAVGLSSTPAAATASSSPARSSSPSSQQSSLLLLTCGLDASAKMYDCTHRLMKRSFGVCIVVTSLLLHCLLMCFLFFLNHRWN